MTFRKNIICFLAIFNKEVQRFLRVWGQSLVPPIITSSLYFLIFGAFIGSRIETVGGFNFIAFITPGLIMMSVISGAYLNVCSSFYIAKFQKNIEEILVSPCSSHVLILGYVAAGVLRAMMVGLIIYSVSWYFTGIKILHVFSFFVFLLCTSFLFALAGLLNAIFARKFDDISIIPTFILTPLSYLGGIFYSLEQIPENWRVMMRFNPIFYLINGLRYSILGISEAGITFSLFILFVMMGVLYTINYYLIERGVGIKS